MEPPTTPDKLCHHYTEIVPVSGHDTIDCDAPLSGRYVYVVRDDKDDRGVRESHYMSICEALVHGYKPLG